MASDQREAALKPCPFCDGVATISRRGDRRESTLYMCTECGCTLETSETFNHGADWNRRAPAPPTEAEFAAVLTAINVHRERSRTTTYADLARIILNAFISGRSQ